MKFFFDRNWSPYLASAIGELCKPHKIEVIHLDQRFERTCADVDWINELAQEGGWAILTKDRMAKSPAEREALRQTGIVTFIFSKQWSEHREWDQAWALVRWWPAIMEVAARMNSGAFVVPYRYTGTGKMEPVRF